jgi:hypothetical protein
MKILLFFLILTILISCTKSSNNEESNPCAGINIQMTTNITPAVTGQSNGSIQVVASGSANFTYSLNNSAPQASTTFSNLAAGNYTVLVKNSDGCSASVQVVLNEVSPCTLTNISITTTIHTETECVVPADGSITVHATGSTGFTYSLDGINFQSSNVFNNLKSGTKTITVKDVNNCTKTTTIIIGVTPAGPMFTAVKNLIQANCVACHNPSNPNGINLSNDCNTINNKQKIKERAVEGHPSPMPPSGLLPTSEIKKIVDWINSGGTYAN